MILIHFYLDVWFKGMACIKSLKHICNGSTKVDLDLALQFLLLDRDLIEREDSSPTLQCTVLNSNKKIHAKLLTLQQYNIYKMTAKNFLYCHVSKQCVVSFI